MSKHKPRYLEDFRYHQFEHNGSGYYLTISIPNTSIKINLDYQQSRGAYPQHEELVIKLSQPIDVEHARKVYEKFSRYNIVHGASDTRGLHDEKFMYLIDELLGDLFYELNEEALNEELKELNAKMELSEFKFHFKGERVKERIKELNYIIPLIKFIKTKSPWRENYTRMREELEQTRGLLGLMPKEDKYPTEEEEIAQADARAKQGAIKHREAQEKMRELMRSPEAESLRLQESEYPSVAEHILRAGRKTRRTKK